MSKLWEKLRAFYTPLSWLLFIGTVLALTLIQAGGERLGAAGAILYLPLTLWVLPFGVMLVMGLLLRSLKALLHLAGMAFVLFGYGDFHWKLLPGGNQAAIKVVTNNVGQNNRHTPRDFIEEEKPDAVLLQEAPGRGKNYAVLHPDMHVAAQGEFILLSRHPINRAKLLRELNWHGRPVAARFEIEIGGKAVAIYSIHMPTPRNDLLRLWGRGFAEEVLDPSSADPQGRRMPVNESMRERVRLARRMVEAFKREQMPFIVAGDFNMPSNGHIRRIFSGELRDAFAECGRGYGFTFPGFTRNPLSLFQPWLRLDYLFAGRGFRPCYVRTEPGRPSQHRAVAAGFVFENSP